MTTSDPLFPADAVLEFHQHFGLPARTIPVDRLPDAEVELRRQLLSEEFTEYLAAAGNGDIVAVADALADMVYVIYGTALHYGIDLDAVLAEVHRANMTKTGHNGGKAVKGPGYQPPDIPAVLLAQHRAQPNPTHGTRPGEDPRPVNGRPHPDTIPAGTDLDGTDPDGMDADGDDW